MTKTKSTRAGIGAMTALIAAMLTSGCAVNPHSNFQVGSVPDDYRSSHPIIVSQDQKATQIVVSKSATTMSSRDLGLVRAMGRSFLSSGNATLAIAIPSGAPNQSAARSIASQMVSELQRMHIKSSQIGIQHYDASAMGQSPAIKMSYSDFKAAVASKCGNWSDDLLASSSNKNYKNFGCATQNNLAQMIANPSDLITPQGSSPVDAGQRSRIIGEWQSGG